MTAATHQFGFAQKVNWQTKRVHEIKIALVLIALRFPSLALLLHFTQSKLDSACQWDCKLYSKLMDAYTPGAFFPAWPVTASAVRNGIPDTFIVTNELILIILSILLTLFASRLALTVFNRFSNAPDSRDGFLGYSKGAWLALLLLCIFPSSAFWMAGYSEALLVCLWLAGLISYPARPRLGALCLGLGALIRPQGVWIAGSYGLLLLLKMLREKTNSVKLTQFAGEAFLLAFPFLAFLIWLDQRTGNPFYFVEAQHQWGHHFSFVQALRAHLPRFNLDYLILCFSWYTAYRWRGRAFGFQFLALAGILSCEIPLFLTEYISWTRYQSTNLALFISFAELAAETPWLLIPTFSYCLPNLAIKIAGLVQGVWAG